MKKIVASTLLAALFVLGLQSPASAATVQVTTQTDGTVCKDSDFTPSDVQLGDGDTVVFSVGESSGYSLKLEGFGPAPVTIAPGTNAAFSAQHKSISFTGTWVGSSCAPMKGTITIGAAGQAQPATNVTSNASTATNSPAASSNAASKSDSSVVIAAAAAIVGAVLWFGSSLLLKSKK